MVPISGWRSCGRPGGVDRSGKEGRRPRFSCGFGPDTHVHQGADLKDFLAVLEELRASVRAAALDADTKSDLEGEAEGVKRQAEREAPKKEVITSKLQLILDLLSKASGVGEKLVPLARRLGEMAAVLF